MQHGMMYKEIISALCCEKHTRKNGTNEGVRCYDRLRPREKNTNLCYDDARTLYKSCLPLSAPALNLVDVSPHSPAALHFYTTSTPQFQAISFSNHAPLQHLIIQFSTSQSSTSRETACLAQPSSLLHHGEICY